MEYKNDSIDMKLLYAAQKGDLEAERKLLEMYKKAAFSLCHGFYIPGGDYEDLQQFALIGLFEAIHSYKEEFNVNFWGFSRLCITREILTAVKTANRLKESFLNHYISFDSTICEGTEKTWADVLPDPSSTPEMIVISKEENIERWEQAQRVLSPLMYKIFVLYVQGNNYSEIGDKLGFSNKKVANTMWVIRKKLQKALKENNEVTYS